MRSFSIVLAGGAGLLATRGGATSPGRAAVAAATLEPVGRPEIAFPRVVSTAGSEVKIAFSPDGKRLLWGSTDRRGGPGGWDLWEVVREGEGWSAPRPLPFNSPANDFDPSFAPDGRALYFFSNRPGGLGGDDIYVVPFERGAWGAARNLGAAVNSAGDEWGPVVSPDGARLVFASDGRGGRGKPDLGSARSSTPPAPGTSAPRSIRASPIGSISRRRVPGWERPISIVFACVPRWRNEPGDGREDIALRMRQGRETAAFHAATHAVFY